MSKSDYILPILKTSDYVKDKNLLISNLKNISITLSQLNKQAQLPILSLLISTKELVGKNCEVKTLIVNSILDCIRLALPEFPRYFCIYESEISKVQSHNKATMKIKENKLYEHVVTGVIEQLDFLYKYLVNETCLYSKDDLVLSRYKYTLDRIYNNNQLLFFLFDGLVSNDMKKKLIILIFTKCMGLIGTMKDSNEIAIMAKWVVISMLRYSNDSTGKREMILLIMKDLSRYIIDKLNNMDNSTSENALSIISDILNNLGSSSISFYTNNILQQVIIYINADKYRNQKIKKKLNNKDSIYWWRSEEYTKIPEIIKYIKDYKSDIDAKLVVYEIISILHSIDTEFVQSTFSFIISDLDNINNKERLNNSKYIGKLILSYLINSNNNVLRKRGIVDENYSISQLLDIWLTCIDDKCLDISQNVFSIIYEVIKVYFNSERLVSVSLNKDIICKMVQVCIDNVGNPHITIRKTIIDIFSSILMCSNNHCILSKTKICEIKHYCLQRLCDNDRDVRFQCIKCMKIYKDEPNLINNLWYAWLISVKQNDFILRQMIENIFLTSSATLLFMDKFLYDLENLNECSYKDNEIKSNNKGSKSEVAHKIAIFFFQQRFKALSYFRQYIILRYATIYHQNYLPKNILNILEDNISIILEKFSMFIFHCMEIQTQIEKIDVKQMLQDKAKELIKNLDKILKNINLEDQDKNNHYIWYKLSIISGLSSCIEIQTSEDLLSCKSGMMKVDFLKDYYNMSTLTDKKFEGKSLSRLFMFTSPIYPYFSDYKLEDGLFKVFWLPSHFSMLENVDFHDLLQDGFEKMIRYFNTIVVMVQHCYLINAISSFIKNKKKWGTIANLLDESVSQEVMKIIEKFTNINTVDIYKKYLDKTQNMGFESFYKLIKYIKSTFASINLDHELALNMEYKMVSNCFGAQTFKSNTCIIDIVMNNVFDNISINSNKSLALFWVYNLICSAFPYLNLKLQSLDRSENILKILKSSENVKDKQKNKGKKEKLMAMLQLLCIESMNLIYDESSTTTKDSLYIDLDKSPISSDFCIQNQDLTHLSGLQILKYKKEIFSTLLKFLDHMKGKIIKKTIFKKDEIVEIFLTISIANIMLGKYFSKANNDVIMQLLDILAIISENIIYSEENTSISKSNGNEENNIKFLEQNIVSFIIETQFPTMQRASIYTGAMIMTLSFGQFLKYLCSSENDTWQIFQKKGNIEKLLGLVSLFFEYGFRDENSKKKNSEQESLINELIKVFSYLFFPPKGFDKFYGNFRSILTTKFGRTLSMHLIPIICIGFTKKIHENCKDTIITLDMQNILENIISTYIKSSCNSENIENLYFMMDYILSIFVYSISSKVFENDQINNLSNYFAYILWKQIDRIEGQSYLKNYSIMDIVNHCIALLENIRNYYDTKINNDIIYSNDTTEKICSGMQYHLAYFFINRNNPLHYRIIEDHTHNTTKHWYYLLYNNKFNIPNNLFVKKSFRNSENSTEYQIVARFNKNTENFTNQALQPNSIDKIWKKTTFSLKSNLNKYTNSDIKQDKRKIKAPLKVKKLKRSKLNSNKENNFYNDSYSEESLESDNQDGEWRGSKNNSKFSNLVVNENQKLRRSSRIFNIQQANSNIPIR